MQYYGYILSGDEYDKCDDDWLGRMANGDACGGIFADWSSHEYTPFSDRPAGKKLWATLRAGDIIVVPYTHTIFRGSHDYRKVLGELHDKGVTVLIEGVSPMAREGMRVLADVDHRGKSRSIKRGQAKRKIKEKQNGEATKTESGDRGDRGEHTS